jgi:hypothetical protein
MKSSLCAARKVIDRRSAERNPVPKNNCRATVIWDRRSPGGTYRIGGRVGPHDNLLLAKRVCEVMSVASFRSLQTQELSRGVSTALRFFGDTKVGCVYASIMDCYWKLLSPTFRERFLPRVPHISPRFFVLFAERCGRDVHGARASPGAGMDAFLAPLR